MKKAVHAQIQHRKSSKSRSGQKKVAKENHYWQKDKRFINLVSIKNENCTLSPKRQGRESVIQFLLNYPQMNNGQPQELTSKSRSFWKEKTMPDNQRWGIRLHHISASAANLNITTSTWTKHIPPSLFPGSVYSFHLKKKTVQENKIQGITR